MSDQDELHDPDTVLRAMKRLLHKYPLWTDADAVSFVELFRVLDNWMSQGGYLPTIIWATGRPRKKRRIECVKTKGELL